MKKNLVALFLGIVVSWIVGELVVRGSGKYETWNERNGYEYESVYEVPEGQRWYLTWTPNQEVCDDREEFDYCKQVNSIGLMEREITKEKDSNDVRVFVFGDSFTEGMGAPVDSSWVRVCENKFSQTSPVEVVYCNAGVSGSDPVWNLKLFEDSLASYQSDLVLLAINETDINEIFTRLAYERFLSDGTVSYRRPPWFEPFYKRSYVVRLICHELFFMNHMLLRPSELRQAVNYGAQGIKFAIQKFDRICKEKGLGFGVVFTPLQHNIEAGHEPFKSMSIELSSQGIPNLNVQEKLLEKGVITKENVGEYYWPIDGHFNSKGYALVGTEVAEWMKNSGLLKTKGVNYDL